MLHFGGPLLACAEFRANMYGLHVACSQHLEFLPFPYGFPLLIHHIALPLLPVCVAIVVYVGCILSVTLYACRLTTTFGCPFSFSVCHLWNTFADIWQTSCYMCVGCIVCRAMDDTVHLGDSSQYPAANVPIDLNCDFQSEFLDSQVPTRSTPVLLRGGLHSRAD